MNAGFLRLTIHDPELGLDIPCMVFYPSKGESQQQAFGPYTLDIAIGASPEGENLPLVLISHGSGGSGMVYRDLAIHLAKSGYIVALPEHPFNNRLDNSWEGNINNLIHRPRHMSLVINHLEKHEKLSANLQSNQVAVIGHSMGGYTALAMAGGKPNTKHLIEYCKQPENQHLPFVKVILSQNPIPQILDIEKDLRVKALILMAGASIDFKSPGALDEVETPVLMYTPTKDPTAAPQAQIVWEGLKKKDLVRHKIIENAGHYSFLSPFPASIRDRVGPAGVDPAGFDRLAFLAQMNEEILSFLKEVLT